MLKFSCPSCGAEIIFKSKASVFAICSYCKSTVVRQDLNIELYGKMSELQEDMSPFQIGTKGFYKREQFELIGRLRMSWENGFWNEWYALMPHGQEAWLAEAQGLYMFSFPSEQVSLPVSPESLSIGSVLVANNRNYYIKDMKESTCIGSEGELPFSGALGKQSLSMDLSAERGYFANLEYTYNFDDKLESRLYLGEYLGFDSFDFSNLREIEGWKYER